MRNSTLKCTVLEELSDFIVHPRDVMCMLPRETHQRHKQANSFFRDNVLGEIQEHFASSIDLVFHTRIGRKAINLKIRPKLTPDNMTKNGENSDTKPYVNFSNRAGSSANISLMVVVNWSRWACKAFHAAVVVDIIDNFLVSQTQDR